VAEDISLRKPFSKRKLFRVFAAYLILILVPLSVLIYLGITSLENNRRQIEDNVHNRLQQVSQDFNRDMESTWNLFLEQEKYREFAEYLPLMYVAGENGDAKPLATQFSPLLETMDGLDRLTYNPDLITSNEPGAPMPSYILENTVVGYFQFDPHTESFTTPYDQASPQAGKPEALANFRRFLKEQVMFRLIDLIGNLDDDDLFVALRSLKAQSVYDVERSVENVRAALALGDIPLVPAPETGRELLNVYYYSIHFFRFNIENDGYIVGLRPVLLGKKLLFQGFVLNPLIFIQDSQGYLESQQPQYGNVVIVSDVDYTADQNAPPRWQQTYPLFEPFNHLSIVYKVVDNRYLQSYYEERDRFWITGLCLMLALLFTLFHLSRLVSANVDLYRKKNNFISAITHELKAPLTSIIMYAEMLSEGWAQGKEKVYYRHIHWESERLLRLIRNILDYSGLERGVFIFNKTDLKLHEFIEETLDPLRDWVAQSGLDVDLEIEAEPSVRIDRDSLSQVIYNLCDNTIKYGMSQEQPRLVIRVAEDDRHGLLQIYDNGPGVAKEERDKILRKFYRIENEMTRESTGTGLGLALVKELVEGNGGRLGLFVPDGGGFGVDIRFPKVSDPS
jgi:signal transduction histidine kinase